MENENEIVRVDGKIEGFEPREVMVGVKIRPFPSAKFTSTYWIRKDMAHYKDGEQLDLGDWVVFEERKNEKGHHNVVGLFERFDNQRPSASNLPEKPPEKLEDFPNDFKQASSISKLDDRVDGNLILMGKCYEGISKMLGKKPENNEVAMVNTIFLACKNERN